MMDSSRKTVRRLALVILILCVCMVTPPSVSAVDPPEGTLRLFLDIFRNNKEVFTGKGWSTTEKNGIRTVKQIHVDEGTAAAEGTYEYVIDKKNWYMKVSRLTDTSTKITEVGMYFRKDSSPLVGVSVVNEGFGGGGATYNRSTIRFYDFRCLQKGKNEYCQPGDVTDGIFPRVSLIDFIKDDPPAKDLLKKNPEWLDNFGIYYSVPRIGTAVSAHLWANSRRITDLYPGGAGDTGSPPSAVLVKYTLIRMGWNKKLEKFEIVERKYDKSAVQYFGN